MANRPRRKNPFLEKTGDRGAQTTGTINGAIQYAPEWAKGAIITLVASAASGNTSMQVQFSPDGSGTTWLNYGAASSNLSAAGNVSLIFYPTNLSLTAGASPTNFTTGGTAATVIMNAPIPPMFRVVYTVATSITITDVYVNYLS